MKNMKMYLLCALTVLALFAAYAEVVEANGMAIAISLREPLVVAGVLLGATAPPIFAVLHDIQNAFARLSRSWRKSCRTN